MKRRALIAGVARDCSQHLPAVFANLERISSTYDEVAFCFVENDSQDDTQALLVEFGRGRQNYNLFNLNGLGQLPIRTLRLEYARNSYLAFARLHPSVCDFDDLVVVDMDDAAGHPLESTAIQSAQNKLAAQHDLAAVFANQRGLYYDLWALRAKDWCPDDIWLAMATATLNTGLSDDAAYTQVFAPRVRSLDPGSPPLEVESAFGGLGIYKLAALKSIAGTYHGAQMHIAPQAGGTLSLLRMQQCEHVPLHLALRAAGYRLVIDPSLINRVMPPTAKFPAGAYRSMMF